MSCPTRIAGTIVTLAIFVLAPGIGADATEAATASTSPVNARFMGSCNTSVAIPFTGTTFLVASDEDQILRLYDWKKPGPPIATSRDLSLVFGAQGKGEPPDYREIDLEGGVRVGDSWYFLGSHGRNPKGKARPGRKRLAMLTLERRGDHLFVAMQGVTDQLLLALEADWRFSAFELDSAAAKGTSEVDALNLETLAAAPGGELLVGFRSPVSEKGEAIIAKILNPDALATGEPLRIAEPIRLDLGGRGLRAMIELPGKHGQLIIAGAEPPAEDFQIYTWKTATAKPEVLEHGAPIPLGFRPESAVYDAEADELLLFSDDGKRRVDAAGTECEDLPEAERAFRTHVIPFALD